MTVTNLSRSFAQGALIAFGYLNPLKDFTIKVCHCVSLDLGKSNGGGSRCGNGVDLTCVGLEVHRLS